MKKTVITLVVIALVLNSGFSVLAEETAESFETDAESSADGCCDGSEDEYLPDFMGDQGYSDVQFTDEPEADFMDYSDLSDPSDTSYEETEEPFLEGESMEIDVVSPVVEEGVVVDDSIEVVTIEDSDVLAATTHFTSESSLGEYVRECAISRETHIELTFDDGSYWTSSDAFAMIYDEINEHTGVPGQGDNFRYKVHPTVSVGHYSNSTKLLIYVDYEYVTSEAQEEALASRIEEVLDSLNIEGKSDYVKICAIYDYICTNVTYDYAHLNDSDYWLKYTGYAALINGTSVCAGYADLFYQMALTAGIEDVRIDEGSVDRGLHAWNIVRIGSCWYYLDPTWDAVNSFNTYRYFLKGSSSFCSDHTPERGFDYNVSSSDYSGWIYHNESFYYRNSNGCYATGWKKISGNYYYFKTTGVMVTGWQNIGSTWYYFRSSGIMATGWQKVGNNWYHFAASGSMQVGWQKLSGKWYYFSSNGKMSTGWKKLDGSWYYFKSSGAMATDWQKVDNKWYYLGDNGKMVTGWIYLGDSWYYLESSGAMATGWFKLNGQWFYIK